MPGGLSAVEKFNNYVSTHQKECSGKSAYEICTSILEMNENELKEIEANKFLLPFIYTAEDNKQSPYNPLGLDLSKNKTNKTPQITPEKKQNIPKPKLHPQAQFAEVNNAGLIKQNQFEIEELKKKYNNKEYTVSKDAKTGIITVKNKKNGSIILEVTKRSNLRTDVTYKKDPHKKETLTFDSGGQVWSYKTTVKGSNGNTTETIYSKGSQTPSKITEYNPDKKCQKIFDKNGMLTTEYFYEGDNNQLSFIKYYSNGQVYKTNCLGVTTYPLVDDLGKILAKKNLTPKDISELSTNILKRMNENNGQEIADKYKQTFNRELPDDIKKMPIPESIKDKLITRILQLDGYNLAYELWNDISGPGSGDLKDHIKLINANNIKYVLVGYRERAFVKNVGGKRTIDENSMWFDKINSKVRNKLKNKYIDTIRPKEGLLTAISDEVGLFENEKRELLNHIIDTALKNCSPKVKKVTYQAILTHPDDMHKIELDLYRAMNLEDGKLDKSHLDLPDSSTNNNSFKGAVSQGKTGDCWLVAGAISGIYKKRALEKMEHQVTYDRKTDTYFVELKGLNETISVKGSDFKDRTFISSGSNKLKALEVAFDNNIRDKSYNTTDELYVIDNGTITGVDIVGGKAEDMWQALFGNDGIADGNTQVDPLTEDFSNPDVLYTMWLKNSAYNEFNKHVLKDIAKDSKGKNYTFKTHHEISIIGSDKDNIYLIDPNTESDDIITVSRKKFAKLKFGISSYTFFK